MAHKADIFYCSFGAGHRRAAEFIREQLCGNDVECVDLYKAIYPHLYKAIYAFYADFIRKRNCWFRIYSAVDNNNEKVLPRLNFLRCRFFRYLDSRPLPDVFVATYSIAATLLNEYIELRRLSVPLITCITDFAPHAHWINPHTSLYLVASGYTENLLRRNEIPHHRILRFGLTSTENFVPGMFAQMQENTVMISGGGLGLLPQNPEFYKTIHDKFDCPVNIVTGNNRKLKKVLNEALGGDGDFHIHGFVKNMDLLWQQTGVFIGKAGGLSTFEAMAHGCPIFYIDPYLSQEKKNADFIQNSGIGAPLCQVLQTGALPEHILDFAACRERMHQEIYALHPSDLGRQLDKIIADSQREEEFLQICRQNEYQARMAL